MFGSLMPCSFLMALRKCAAADFSASAAEQDLRLLAFSGGTLRNAIPREAFATVAVESHKADALKSAAAHFLSAIKNEHGIN